MRSGTIAFLIGILCLQGFATLPAREWIVLLAVSIPLALFLPLPWRLVGWGLSGFFWCLWSAHHILAVSLPVSLEGQDLIIEGRIAGLPESRQRRTRFLFDVSQLMVDGERRSWPARVRLNWYGQPPPLQAGDGWRLRVRLKRPHGFRNPGGFDYERWLFAQRIRATGYVREAEAALDDPIPARFALDRFRQWLSERLEVHLSGQSGALLRALTLGDRRAISPQTWAWLRQTGTAHLLAISGMHIGLLAALMFWLVRRIWPLAGERAVNRLPAPRVAAVFAMLAAVGYAALAGFSIPTQRALVMLMVVMLALWRMRPLVPGQTLAWAGLLVLLLDPLAVLSAGFWLSFAAVAVILYILGGRRFSWPHQWLRIQAGVTLGLTPLLLGWFQQVSLVAPLTNLLAIPLVSLLVVPLALLAVLALALWPDGATVLLTLVAWLLDGLLAGLGWFAGWPLAHWRSASGVMALGLLASGLFLALAPRGFPGRYLAPLLCLPLLVGAPLRPPPERAWLTLLDVGQGLAIAVQTRSHVLIFDTGPRYSARFDTGAAVVLPYLRHSGYRRVDRLVISHGDNDHRGGVVSLRAGIPVEQVYTSVPQRVPGERVVPCQAGQQWQWDGVRFAFLSPLPGTWQGNDASCVLRIEAAGQVALLSADIEQAGERQLLQRLPEALPASILIAPHHGSLTSSTPDFVKQVHPEYVLYPVGYRNRYRFPRGEVVKRYARLGARQYRSDVEGAVRFLLGDPGGPRKLYSYRPDNLRYWHSRIKQPGW